MQRILNGLLWLAVLSLLALSFLFATNPESAFNWSGHAQSHLRQVISNRYFALAFFLAAAIHYPDRRVLFGGAIQGFWDAAIYSSLGPSKHLMAGALALFGSLIVWPHSKTTE